MLIGTQTANRATRMRLQTTTNRVRRSTRPGAMSVRLLIILCVGIGALGALMMVSFMRSESNQSLISGVETERAVLSSQTLRGAGEWLPHNPDPATEFEFLARTQFPTFADYTHLLVAQPQSESSTAASQPHKRRLRIAFGTFALIGPIKNGGIATADTSLAESLVEAGHEVTVVYMWGTGVQLHSIKHWIEFYEAKQITLVALPSPPFTTGPSVPSKYITKSYHVYLWFKKHQHEFDLIHWHEWHGPGYYSVLAKHQGLAFKDVQMVTTVHCPSMFYLRGNMGLLNTWNNFASDFLEREQVLLSDVVISPSAFMLGWIQSQGWKLPDHVFVQQNILTRRLIEQSPKYGSPKYRTGRPLLRVNEVVFFARLEVLKGIQEFCEALDTLAVEINAGKLRTFNVTFLGNANMGGIHAGKYLRNRHRDGRWPFHMEIYTNKLQPEAVGYVKGGDGRISILTSLIENSPYTVLECLAMGIPFLTSNVGGIPELIHPDDRPSVLFSPKPWDIVRAVRNAIVNGVRMARGTSDPLELKQEWLDFHHVVDQKLYQQTLPEDALLIGVPTSMARSAVRSQTFHDAQVKLEEQIRLLHQNEQDAGRHPDSARSGSVPQVLSRAQQRSLYFDEIKFAKQASKRFHSHSHDSDDPSAPFQQPFVTVIVVHHERGVLLLKTVEALLRQNYTNFEIVMVDDGSVKPEAIKVLALVERFFAQAPAANGASANQHRLLPEFRLVRQENKYPGAARNLGVQHAHGEYVLFLDDDDIPRPYWLSTFARVAVRTNADVVTSMFDFFRGDSMPLETDKPNLRWLSIGAAPDLGLWHNVYGAYSAFVRRSVFLEIGGFSEDFGTTFEDYEFFSNAVLKGYRLELIPEGLLWYRQNKGKHLMKTTNRYHNRMRALRPYLKHLPPFLRNSIKMAYGIGADKK